MNSSTLQALNTPDDTAADVTDDIANTVAALRQAGVHVTPAKVREARLAEGEQPNLVVETALENYREWAKSSAREADQQVSDNELLQLLHTCLRIRIGDLTEQAAVAFPDWWFVPFRAASVEAGEWPLLQTSVGARGVQANGDWMYIELGAACWPKDEPPSVLVWVDAHYGSGPDQWVFQEFHDVASVKLLVGAKDWREPIARLVLSVDFWPALAAELSRARVAYRASEPSSTPA